MIILKLIWWSFWIYIATLFPISIVGWILIIGFWGIGKHLQGIQDQIAEQNQRLNPQDYDY